MATVPLLLDLINVDLSALSEATVTVKYDRDVNVSGFGKVPAPAVKPVAAGTVVRVVPNDDPLLTAESRGFGIIVQASWYVLGGRGQHQVKAHWSVAINTATATTSNYLDGSGNVRLSRLPTSEPALPGVTSVAEFVAAALAAGLGGPKGDKGDKGDASTVAGPTGRGVPNGGAAGQVLTKVDGSDYSASWTNPPTSSSTNNAVAYGMATTTANDTSALLAALNAAAAAGKAFTAPPGAQYQLDPLDIPSGVKISGDLSVKGRTPGQDYVLRFTGAPMDLEGSRIAVDANGAVDGIRLYNAGRSRFGSVTSTGAARDGIRMAQTDGVTTNGNNNLTSWKHVRVYGNGTKVSTASTVAAVTGSLTSLNAGYVTLTLATALPSWAPTYVVGSETIHSAYFVNIGGQAYRVRQVTSVNSIDVFNAPYAVGDGVNVDVLLGAGFNVPKFHDNHAGWVGLIDAQSNKSIGIHHSPGYGWTLSKAVLQGNPIGFGTWDYSQATTLNSPYFELNTIDIAIGTNLDATITNPQCASLNVQSLGDRLSTRGQAYHGGLTVVGSSSGAGGRVGNICTDQNPSNNPGTTTITSGGQYGFTRTAGNWAFRIGSIATAATYGALLIDLSLLGVGGWSGTCTFTFDTTGGRLSGDTVMGGTTYTTPAFTSARITLMRVGTDWQVLIK